MSGLFNAEERSRYPKLRVRLDHSNAQLGITFFRAFFRVKDRSLANSHIPRSLCSCLPGLLPSRFRDLRQFPFLNVLGGLHAPTMTSSQFGVTFFLSNVSKLDTHLP
jgi:hypothetical protein